MTWPRDEADKRRLWPAGCPSVSRCRPSVTRASSGDALRPVRAMDIVRWTGAANGQYLGGRARLGSSPLATTEI
jgi:hypothetical protein